MFYQEIIECEVRHRVEPVEGFEGRRKVPATYTQTHVIKMATILAPAVVPEILPSLLT
jgi:hypothetical protein